MNTPEMITDKEFGKRSGYGPETGSSPDYNHVADQTSYRYSVELTE